VRRTFSLLPLLVWSAFITGATAWAEPIAFDVPAQSADTALLAVSRQAHIEVLFSFDDLHQKTSSAVVGNLEPEAALAQTLQGHGLRRARHEPWKVCGHPHRQAHHVDHWPAVGPDGTAARGVRVTIPAATCRSAPMKTASSLSRPSLRALINSSRARPGFKRCSFPDCRPLPTRR